VAASFGTPPPRVWAPSTNSRVQPVKSSFALKASLVEEEEWFTIVGTIVHAHRFALYAVANQDVSVTLYPKHPTLEVRLAAQVCPPVSERGEGGGFSKELVRGPRV